MIENDYLLLECIYPFYNKNVLLTESSEQILEKVTTEKIAAGSKLRLERKVLIKNYGITDEKSLIEWLSYLHKSILDQISRQILFDLFLENKESFLTFTDSFLREKLTDDYLQEITRKYNLISNLSDNHSFITDFYYEIKDSYFNNKSIYYEFFTEYEELILLCSGLMGTGFDRIRQISIIRNSYEINYIQENTAQKLLTRRGIETKNLFKNWSEYFASVLLGKIFKTDFDGMVGKTITETKKFAETIYMIINSEKVNELLPKIWEDTDFSKLLAFLNKKYTFEEAASLSTNQEFFLKTKTEVKLIEYPKNYNKFIANKDSDYLISLNEKPSLKRIRNYDRNLKGFITWKKNVVVLFLLSVSLRFLLNQAWIASGISIFLVLIFAYYLHEIGTPKKLYEKGTLLPAIVVEVVDDGAVKLFTIAPLAMMPDKNQRWGIRTITIQSFDFQFELYQKTACVSSYGDYKSNYYKEFSPHPIFFGYDDSDILNKALKKIDASQIYPKNIWELLPDIYDKYSEYILTETVVLDENFEAINES